MIEITAHRLTHHRLTLAIDYGQFTVTGSNRDTDTLELLVQAQARPPSSGNRGTVLILSPHQNNFATAVDVEVWDARPPTDRDLWQQVSEDPIDVDDRGLISLESPTMNSVDCPIPAGHYVLEASGRGFINYGWPGSTTPGTPAMSVSWYVGWNDRWVDPSVMVKVHSIPKGTYV